MKITGAKSFSLESAESRNDKFEVTVLHWGKFENDSDEKNNIRLYSVKDIKMPEPNDVTVEYKIGSIATIPEDLYKYNTGMTELYGMFEWCNNLATIPEGLFKYNKNVTKIIGIFSYTKITTIPENLFKYNKEVVKISGIFQRTKITTIPENLFKYNTEVLNLNNAFSYCEKLTNIPSNLFQNNNKSNTFYRTFSHCTSLTHLNLPNRLYSLPESQYRGIFEGCTNAYNYSSIPEAWKQ